MLPSGSAPKRGSRRRRLGSKWSWPSALPSRGQAVARPTLVTKGSHRCRFSGCTGGKAGSAPRAYRDAAGVCEPGIWVPMKAPDHNPDPHPSPSATPGPAGPDHSDYRRHLTTIARVTAAWLRAAAAWLATTATSLRNTAEPAVRRAVLPAWRRVAPRLAVAVEKVRAVLPADVFRLSDRKRAADDRPAAARLRTLQAGLSAAAVGVVALMIVGVAATAHHAPPPTRDAALRMLQPAPSTATVVPPAGASAAPASSAASTPSTSSASQQPSERKASKPTSPASSSAASASTTPSEPGPEYGIDVSNYNGDINWKKVAAYGKRFAYVEATDGGGFANPLFQSQVSGAKDAGLLVGAYHFARPYGSASDQADTFLSTLHYKADDKTLPPELDLEVNPADGGCYGLSAGEMQDWVKAFNARVKATTGTDMVLYANSSFWSECMADTDAFSSTNPLFLAKYGVSAPSVPAGWDHYTFWQNSESGWVNGVSGDVDLDVFNGSLDQLKKFTQH